MINFLHIGILCFCSIKLRNHLKRYFEVGLGFVDNWISVEMMVQPESAIVFLNADTEYQYLNNGPVSRAQPRRRLERTARASVREGPVRGGGVKEAGRGKWLSRRPPRTRSAADKRRPVNHLTHLKWFRVYAQTLCYAPPIRVQWIGLVLSRFLPCFHVVFFDLSTEMI